MTNEFLNPVRNSSHSSISDGVKLTNAVYKLLESFPESDPLKNRAKDKALAIAEHLVLVSAGQGGWVAVADALQKEKAKAHVLEDIDIFLGYLWIGKSQGWLNSSNCLIITNEYEKIKREIQPLPVEMTQELPLAKSVKISPKPVLNNMSDRQRKIIDFLSQNEKAQVMDLQKILPDVTKRTIRRDLDQLLEMGKIDREGEFSLVFYRMRVRTG